MYAEGVDTGQTIPLGNKVVTQATTASTYWAFTFELDTALNGGEQAPVVKVADNSSQARNKGGDNTDNDDV